MNKSRFNILLVEDNPDHAELVMRGLGDIPIANRIFHVSDGESALDYLFGRGVCSDRVSFPMPDLILLDLRLPRIDGLEVLRTIKSSEETSSIPTVILTTSGSEKDVNRAYRDHANSYLVKPMDFAGFMNLGDDLGTYWLDRNQGPSTKQMVM